MMNALPEPAAERTHWTNYEVTFHYGDLLATGARVKVTEGRETLADLPALIARAHREHYPDPDQIAIVRIEVTRSTRTGDLLAPWLAEIACARTLRALRAIADGASATCVIGPRARRRTEAEVLTRRLREREAELTAPRALEPTTYRHTAPADLVGRQVKAQPFYHVPVPGGAHSARAEHAHTGVVTEVFGIEMVVVAFGPDAPGSGRQAFFPRELHETTCTCPPCAPARAHTQAGGA